MNDTLKKLSDDTKSAIIASIASDAVSKLIASTKSSADNDAGSFKVVASTSDVDRQGESVNQLGWDLSFYKSNPVVLWAHDYSALPIGVCTSIEVKDGKLVAEGKFAPADANPFAQQIRKLYDLGMVNTTSVGFIPKEYDGTKTGVISKSELLEFSFVPVPANPYALRLNQIKELGIDTIMLRTKGIEVKEEVANVAPTHAPEKKGEVANELDAIEKQNIKYSNFRKVWSTIDALCMVYFDDKTAVEDFSKLLGETADILKGIAGGGDEKLFKESIAKMLGERKETTFNELLIPLIRNHVAFGSLELAKGDVSGKETIPAPQRSINSEALKEINNFVETRTLLRGIDNSIEKVLRNFNAAARNR